MDSRFCGNDGARVAGVTREKADIHFNSADMIKGIE
jgi:hypothetical protein